jgi:hypothetical protein
MSSPISWETALARSADAKRLEASRLGSRRVEPSRKAHPFPRFAALRSRNTHSHR